MKRERKLILPLSEIKAIRLETTHTVLEYLLQLQETRDARFLISFEILDSLPEERNS